MAELVAVVVLIVKSFITKQYTFFKFARNPFGTPTSAGEFFGNELFYRH